MVMREEKHKDELLWQQWCVSSTSAPSLPWPSHPYSILLSEFFIHQFYFWLALTLAVPQNK